MKHITWNLRILFKNDDDPEIDKKRRIVKEKSSLFIKKWKNRSDYLRHPVILKKALDEYEKWKRVCGTDGD